MKLNKIKHVSCVKNRTLRNTRDGLKHPYMPKLMGRNGCKPRKDFLKGMISNFYHIRYKI